MVMTSVDVAERFASRSFELKHLCVSANQGFMWCSTCPFHPIIQERTGRRTGNHHDVWLTFSKMYPALPYNMWMWMHCTDSV